MATHTDAEMLKAVRAAIYAIVTKGHASYTIGDRTYTRQDLDKLERLETYYQGRVNANAADARRPAVVKFREAT